MQNQGKIFYKHLHAFRGFSILNIIAAHCWVMLIMILTEGDVTEMLKPLMGLSEAFFHNATVYFAIISGLLFSLIFNQTDWKTFYLGKVKHVIMPYIVFSILLTFLGGMVLIPPDVEPLSFNAVLASLPLHIVSGSSFGHMWYIPVLVVLFICTPIFKYIAHQPKLLPLFIIILLLPLFISRSWPDFTWKNFVFFFAPYLLGIYVGNYYQKTLAIMDKYFNVLCGVAFVTTAILIYLYLVEFEMVAGIKLQESIGYIQKVSICFIVLSLMHRKEDSLPKFLYTCGTYSFGLYFVHMVFILIFAVILVQTGITSSTISSILLTGCLLFIVSTVVSIGFIKLVKKLTGKYSRLVIGS